jgi:hypothetical protein
LYLFGLITAITKETLTASGTIKNANLSGYHQAYHSYPYTYPYYDYERDPRQWLSGGYGGYSPMYPFMGGHEAIVIGLMIAIGVGFIGLPLIILIFSMFTGNSNLNFVPPSTTTTLTGRKKREILESLFPKMNPQVQDKVLYIFEQFSKTDNKMDFLKKLLDS